MRGENGGGVQAEAAAPGGESKGILRPVPAEEETAEIISRLLMFSASPQRTVASMSLIRLAKAYGIKRIPHPAYSLNILMDILEEEQRRALARIHQ